MSTRICNAVIFLSLALRLAVAGCDKDGACINEADSEDTGLLQKSSLYRQPLALSTTKPVTYNAASIQLKTGYALNAVALLSASVALYPGGVDIVVFPEVGPGWGCTSEATCASWPAADPDASLCGAPGAHSLVSELACVAKAAGIYVAVNTADRQPCTRELSALCPPVGWFKFSAEVVFDRKGALVAKYYKHSLFSEYLQMSQPVPALLEYYKTNDVFETDFGVRFGIAICNDLNNNALMRSYKDRNISDLIVSDAWEDSNSQQTMATMLTGLSYTYNLNFVVGSASIAAGGSGQYSGGLIVNNSFHPGCIQGTPSGGISGDCDDVVISSLTSPPAKPVNIVDSMVKYTASDMIWPSEFTSSCLGVVLPNLIILSSILPGSGLGPAATYSPWSATSMMQRYYGNDGRCAVLKSPEKPGVYRFEVKGNGIVCSVEAKVRQIGTRGETYVLRAIKTSLYIPMTPCPMVGSMCTFSRCVNYGPGNNTCISWVDKDDDQSEFTQFEYVSMKASVPAGTISYPMMANGYLRSVSATSLNLAGPWSPFVSGVAATGEAMTVEMTAPASALKDGFGFLSAYGAAEVKWPDYCDACSSPFAFADNAGAHLKKPSKFSPLRRQVWDVFCGTQNPIYGKCGEEGQPPCFLSLPEGQNRM